MAFVPYVMAGDPDLATTILIVRALSDVGADIVGLGIPSGAAAHASETTVAAVLACVRLHRDAIPPVVLFASCSAIYEYGVRRFARDAADCGCAGVVVPDVAPRRAPSLRRALKAAPLEMPLLVEPETPRRRARTIVKASTGFVYLAWDCVKSSTRGVPNFQPLYARLGELRAMTDLPLVVGFEIRRAEDIAQFAGGADGFVVSVRAATPMPAASLPTPR